MLLRKCLVIGAMTLMSITALASPASAATDNVVVAVNRTNGSRVVKVALVVDRTSGSRAKVQNVAVAYSNCHDCLTVAVSVQVIVVPLGSTVDATSIAMATSDTDCEMCSTLATTYQIVIVGKGKMQLSSEGQRRVQQLERELRELEHSKLSGRQIHDRLTDLAAEADHIFSTEVSWVPEGRQKRGSWSTRTYW